EEVRGIPNRGIGYGVLKYLTEDEGVRGRVRGLPEAAVSFNYLGQTDQSLAGSTLFNLGRQPDSPARSPLGRRAHFIEIDCVVAQGRLSIQFTFSHNVHRRESVEHLAECFTDELNGLIAQCRSQVSTVYAASDFPLAGLDQEGLNRLAASYPHIEDIYPLSPMQRGMLFHSLYEPESDIYITQMTCELTGELEPEALCWAWQQVIDRHTILRTAVEWEQVDEPLQVVVRRAELSIEQQDWRGMDEDEQRQKLGEHLREGRGRGFDFRRPPLMRVGLMRLADNKHLFVWEHHHLLLDGWSTAALIQEVFSCYEARTRGEQVRLDKRRPYRDYIQWVMRQDQSKAQQYWQRELGGVKAAGKLGVDTSRSNHSRQGYTQQALILSEQQSEKLNRFARQQRVTLNTIMQGCWAVLMSRYSLQQEVIFGVTVSGRGMALEGVGQMIGLMINTLPMRVEVPASLQVGEWLRAIQQKQGEQREYEYSSLWQVQGWSGVEAGEQLFDSLLVFENYPVEARLKEQFEEGARLAVSNVKSVEETNYGLTVAVLPGREISIEIGYERQRYDESMIRRMLGHLGVLLGAMAADPLRPISRLPLMTDSERRQLLVGFNHTSAPFPADKCIHELIERQAERTPGAVAVISGHSEVTYSELNHRANRLARHLRHLSAAPEHLIAICLDSSAELVTSMLAVAKSGAAYLPLDPSNPPDRLAFMIEDAGARLAVTLGRFRHLLPARLPAVVLDSDRAAISPHGQDNLDNVATSGNAVYAVYTSGSTGTPKGIIVEHRSLVNECLAFASHHALKPGDRLLQFASSGFDVAAEEVFSPLLSGAAVVVGLDRSAEGVEGLLARCGRERVSVLNLPSAYWHEWVSQIGRGEARLPDSLRLVIVGNERVSPERFRQWQGAVGGRVEWKNAYGPTEATITSTVYSAASGEGEGEGYVSSQSVPIGRPIANAQVYILDGRLEPVPVGVAGEIYIGGAGVARGYLNRAELTAESFVPDPFGGAVGARLYRTGDRGRYLEDGQVEFLGRDDQQVKVRGYRVELGEVESALCGHPSVSEAVVVARRGEGEGSHARLVGYAVSPGGSVTGAELKEYLAARLPDYMRPAAVVMIGEVPKTPSGKVDRRALPEVEWGGEGGRDGGGKRGPVGEAERVMKGVWEEVLGVEGVGVDDNFFELGGDSILSLQVVARARRAGLRVTPRQVFERPTVAGLAEVAEVAGAGEVAGAEQGAVSGEVKLTPIQRWMLEQELGDVNHYNQAVMLELDGRVSVDEVREVVRGLVEHHDALRMRYRRGARGEWGQECLAEESEEVVEWVDLRWADEGREAEAIREASERAQRSLDIERGPVIRVCVMEAGGVGRKLLLIVVHHLVVDGVSWRVLLEDLGRGLSQVRGGEGVRLEAKTTSFRRWASLLYDYAQSGELRKESTYWLNRNMKPVKPLPVDYKAEFNDERSTQLVSVSLGEKETQALLQEVPKVYHTQIDEVLMAGLVEVLRAWTGEGRVLVDVEGHGREEIVEGVDLTRTVGWFTTIYPVLLDVGETRKTGEVLKRVKQQMRTIPKKGIGYGLLRYLAEDEKLKDDLRKLPEAELSFNYLGQTDQVLNQKALLSMTNEPTGAVVSPKAKRKYLIDINAEIEGGRLNVYWSYSENVHRRQTIERLAEDYIRALRRITIHCQSPEAGGHTPSDFPLARLNQEELGQLEKNYRQIEDIYPLSPMQEGMLFHSLYSPGSDLYFEQFSCRLQGHLDIAAFRQAWQEVINRHSILRTACVWEQLSKPLQIVLRQMPLPYELQDWRGLPPDEQRRQLEKYLDADRSRGFVLSKAPLMRLALIQVADDLYHFVWSHHHLLLDGWSTSVVLKEAFTFYDALCRGEKAHFEQPRPYRDYIAWLQRQDMPKAEEFWRHALKGISAPTPLGVDHSAKAASPQGEQYREERAQLTKAMTASLQSLARQQQLTLSTIIQGAWALLLSRYSGEDEVVYGAVVSGRPAELDETEKMVGLFINTLPVRVKVTGGEPLSNWLRNLQQQQVELRQYEYSPLAAIQGWSEVERGVPLFESIVVFENYPVDKTLGGSSERLKIDDISAEETTNYALTLESSPGEEMRLAIGYDCQRFDEATIRRMLGHLGVLLGAMAADPLRPISRLPLMTDSERRQLL
ncbi:MAG TPA: amino acid adenylation domain-containing protein, partial [Chloroflexia bacterium]|nr:amino acid adenylation domain-containing protein [Chloroflexia bacterium]